jgi:hypothetical protein
VLWISWGLQPNNPAKALPRLGCLVGACFLCRCKGVAPAHDCKIQSKKSELLAQFPFGLIEFFTSENAPKNCKNAKKHLPTTF